MTNAHRRAIAWIMLFVALLVGGGITAASLAPQPAQAGTNLGLARNISGAPIRARCDYGARTYVTLYEKIGPRDPWQSGYGAPCGADTDQVSVPDARCVKIIAFGIPVLGYRLMTPNAWYKISGANQYEIFARTTGKETSYSKRCTTQAPGRGA